ncbi:MAG: hypothetical protein KAS72_08260 [Phycisphaerales bacterium]|nr:hypothetical protein [Phycisphaerales bacterium]
MRKRALLVGGSAVFLGVFTSFVIAWAFAWRADTSGWELDEWCEGRLWIMHSDFVGRETCSFSLGSRTVQAKEGDSEIPAWMETASWKAGGVLSTGHDPEVLRFWAEACSGWPMPALRWMLVPLEYSMGSPPSGSGGMTLQYAHQGPAWLQHAVPSAQGGVLAYRPWWPGLLVDTVLWAAVWSLLLFSPLVVIPHLRLRAGKCPRCRYVIGKGDRSGCPECGWGRDADRQDP